MKNMVKEFRKKADLTQEQIGEALGHQRNWGKSIERKPIELFKIKELFSLASLLKCHPWELMGLPQNLGIDNMSIIRQQFASMEEQLSRALDKIAQMSKENKAHTSKKN